jgi:hypothetical protein
MYYWKNIYAFRKRQSLGIATLRERFANVPRNDNIYFILSKYLSTLYTALTQPVLGTATDSSLTRTQ